MKAGAAGGEDRALLVISGPYQLPVKPGVAQLSQFESFAEQLAELKDDLRNRAAAIDVLELDEKVKNLSAALAGKADTAAVLGLQRDLLKLGMVSNAVRTSDETVAETRPSISPAAGEPVESAEDQVGILAQPRHAERAFTLKAALMVLVIALAAGFAGGWLASRRPRPVPEEWSVKTSGNQITISRKDGSNTGDVTLTAAQPLNSTGQQTFSSFADVQRYIDTITTPETSSVRTTESTQPASSADNTQPVPVTEIRVKSGDSLKRLAQAYNVPPEKLMELNPGITRWPLIRIGQKIVVPSSPATPTSAPVSSGLPTPADQSPAGESGASGASTTEVTVGAGDSLNELARRFNTTAERLKELNPRMNWPRIQRGQKVLVPTPPGG
jgi:LysM repeat protein